MRKLIIALATLVPLVGITQAQTIKEALDKMRVTWDKPTEPFKVIDNVYYVGTEGLASYLIATPQGHILVDTAMPESAALIEANIAKLGFKVTDIKYILNTHAHIDHAGDIAEIKKASGGAQVVAGERDKPLLEGGYYPGAQDQKDLDFPPVKVDRTVHEGDTLTLGSVTLTAYETPGHTPGCTSWSYMAKDGDTTRSVLFFCSATVALNRLVGNPTYPGIIDDYRKTFARAKTMKVDVLLAPHPEMYDMAGKRAKIAPGAPNPFVKPGEFNTYVATLEQQFNEGLATQTAALEKK